MLTLKLIEGDDLSLSAYGYGEEAPFQNIIPKLLIFVSGCIPPRLCLEKSKSIHGS